MNFIADNGYYIAILIRIIAALLIIFQIIPLQFKEAQVKNGLGRLRKQLLIVGFTLFLTNLLAITLIHITKDSTSDLPTLIQIINAFALLILAYILYLIYHEQYTPESKKIHKQIDKAQKKANSKN
jgi:hypothetical protein